MSQDYLEDPYPLNPDYGKGCYRRRIRLSGFPGKVLAELEDSNHGFRSTVFHDGERVTDVQAEALRIPFNTCAGAVDPIKALIGIELTCDPGAINQIVNPRSNCTHIFDLSVLAVSHALRGNVTRVYDVRVDDEVDNPVEAVVHLNGKCVHRWAAWQWQLQSPVELKEKPLFKGFAAWANAYFSGDEREAAFVLHKGYFVANARRYDMDRVAGRRAIEHTHMLGVCHSYTPGIAEHAIRTPNSVRDFSDTPEELLQFLSS